MKAQWDNEKAAIGKVQKLREEIEQVSAEIEKAEREYDLNKAAELKYGQPAASCRSSWKRRRSWPSEAQQNQPAAGQGHRGGDRQDRRPAGPASRLPS